MATHLTTIEPALPIPTRIQSGITPTVFATSRKAEQRFWEFFAATIRNKNTRLAYLHAVFRFADWCEANRIELDDVDALIMSAYVEQLTQVYAAPTVKQHLAAIRMLFDWLVIGPDHRDQPGLGCSRTQICHQDWKNAGVGRCGDP